MLFCRVLKRLSENDHLPFGKPFDKLTVLSKVEGLTALSKVDPSTSLRIDAKQCRSIEGLRYPHPSSLRRTSMYASFLGICPRFAWTPHPAGGSPVSEALHLDIFHQPLRHRFFDSFKGRILLVTIFCVKDLRRFSLRQF